MKVQETTEQPSSPEVINLEELELVWGAGGAESYSGLVCETMTKQHL